MYSYRYFDRFFIFLQTVEINLSFSIFYLIHGEVSACNSYLIKIYDPNDPAY